MKWYNTLCILFAVREFTKVKPKTAEDKRRNMERVRDLLDQWAYVYVFDVRNYTNPHMKALKNHFKYNGQFFSGKVKPTMVALGTTSANEYRENTHLVSNALKTSAKGNHRGLFFCNNGPDEILPFMRRHRVSSFAKTDFVATRDYIIRKGVLSMFSFCQEVQLKRLGLPVLLKRGKLLLNQDYVVCEKGQPLRPEQAKLLVKCCCL